MGATLSSASTLIEEQKRAHGEFCVSRFSARRARLNGRYRENRPCVTSVSYGLRIQPVDATD